jgi:hypothetical protein
MQIVQEVLKWGGAVVVIALAAIAAVLSVSSHIPWPTFRRRKPSRERRPSPMRRARLSGRARQWIRRRTPTLLVGVALVAGVLSIAHITLSPPAITFSSPGPATARASVVVDTPDSILADLRQSTENLQTLDDRGAVLGSVIGSPPVREYVAKALGVRRDQVQIVPPGMEPQTTNAPYQMTIDVNAEVPILDLQAQAPTGAGAVKFANAAVTGLRAYMNDLAAQQAIHTADRVRVTRVGSAVVDYAKPGPDWMHGIIVFALVLGGAYFGLARAARARSAGGRAVGSAA